jgi:hypothetical protein
MSLRSGITAETAQTIPTVAVRMNRRSAITAPHPTETVAPLRGLIRRRAAATQRLRAPTPLRAAVTVAAEVLVVMVAGAVAAAIAGVAVEAVLMVAVGEALAEVVEVADRTAAGAVAPTAGVAAVRIANSYL